MQKLTQRQPFYNYVYIFKLEFVYTEFVLVEEVVLSIKCVNERIIGAENPVNNPRSFGCWNAQNVIYRTTVLTAHCRPSFKSGGSVIQDTLGGFDMYWPSALSTVRNFGASGSAHARTAPLLVLHRMRPHFDPYS
jgi:hypothetical protein